MKKEEIIQHMKTLGFTENDLRKLSENPDFREKVKKKLQEYHHTVIEIQNYFKCDKCGYCCKYAEAYVTKEELEKISQHKKIKRKRIMSYTNKNFNQFSLKAPCPFHEEECTIYPVRPKSCRIFPFDMNAPALQGINRCNLAKEIFDAYNEHFKDRLKLMPIGDISFEKDLPEDQMITMVIHDDWLSELLQTLKKMID